MKKFSTFISESRYDGQRKSDIKDFVDTLVNIYDFSEEQAYEEFERLQTCKTIDDYIRISRVGATKTLNRQTRKEIWDQEYSIYFSKEVNEAKQYEIYHDSYTSAVQEIETYAKDNGFTLDDESDTEMIGDQMATKIGMGHAKPKEGETNKFHLDLYKNNKLIRKKLHAQIYNRGTNSKEFELNMYIG